MNGGSVTPAARPYQKNMASNLPCVFVCTCVRPSMDLLKTIETKSLCASSSNLVHMLTMMRE